MRIRRAVVMGVSAGGLDALSFVLPMLPADYSLPVAVVQHMTEDSDMYLATHLNSLSAVGVKMADEKEPLEPAMVYIAPPAYHLLIEGDHTFSLSVDPRVSFARPSIDVLFHSAAHAYGPALVGVILTGANKDGADGLRAVKDRGGLAIVQDPASAAAPFMPSAAIAAGEVDHVLDLAGIGSLLIGLGRSGRTGSRVRS